MSDQVEGSVAQELTSGLFKACQNSAIQTIVYEICAEPNSSKEAKDRLFRHYASIYGVRLRHIGAKYRQPEICSFDSGECKLTNAELYIGYLGEHAKDASNRIARTEYETLVSSIYRSVYLMSFALAEPQLTKQYGDFLERVQLNLFAGIKTKTIELN